MSTHKVRNHLHIDLAGAILPRTSPDYLELRRKLRSALFDTLAASQDTFGYTYVKLPPPQKPFCYFKKKSIFPPPFGPRKNSSISLTQPPPQNHSYIFTDFQTGNEEGASVATEYATAAKKRGCAFVPVVLTCAEAENERRMRWPERLELVEGGMGMLVDTDVLKGFRARGEIYRFQGPEQLVLDVSEISPAQAAERILQHVGLVTGVVV